MMRPPFLRRAVAGWIAATLVLAAPVHGDELPSGLHTKSCSVGEAKAVAVCGTLTVFEDRAALAGRSIPIRFVVIRAKHGTGRALAFNPGGPGASAVAAAPDFVDGPFATLRERYDILLVDNRGTGASAPQDCDFAPPARPALYFAQQWPDALVKACRDRLSAHANLNLYSSSAAADDLDDIRAVLGYEKLALFGGSYGTRFALVYARQHPQRVESVVLDGVVPLHYYILPLPMAAGAQASIDALIAACRTDALCAKRFPSFGLHFAALARRFAIEPVSVPLQRPAERGRSVRLSNEVFVEAIRHALYSDNAAYVPVVVERAYRGDYAALSALVDQVTQQFAAGESTGLNLSVTCAEDIPFITAGAVARTSAHSFEGDARVRAQQRACRIWNVQPVPKRFIDPVATNLPILMVAESDDPATPPSYAKQALPSLPHARLVIVKGASHQSDLPPCVVAAMASFLRAPSAPQPDLDRCTATYRRPSFATLTYFEPAAGDNAARTARFRRLFTEMTTGRIDRAQVTPTVSKEYPDAVLRQIAAQASGFGPLESFVYRGTVRVPKGLAHRYLAHLAAANANVTMTLDAAGRVAGIDIAVV